MHWPEKVYLLAPCASCTPLLNDVVIIIQGPLTQEDAYQR